METEKGSTRSSNPSFCRRYSVSDFDLAVTLRSGQVFRWREEAPDGFSGWVGRDAVRVHQRNSTLAFEGATPHAIRHFFCLDLSLPSIARSIDVDPIIHQALQTHWGLRLIRQDSWECLASFILSSFNNIPRITGMIERLCIHFGEPAFPKPEVLAKVPERVLRNLGLGFRAPYLKAAAQAVASGKADLEGWNALEDEALRQSLLSIPGVGEKVVECVMLFAYGRTAAFPVDVWIGRAMRRRYFRSRKVSDRKIREFARKHFGPHCGWAQQYLYCYARGAPARISLERTEPSGAIS